MVVATLSKAFTKVFGSRNERLLKGYHRRVAQINALEPEVRRLTDPQLKAKVAEFRDRIARGERIAAMTPDVMAVAREAMDRAVGIRNVFNPAAGFDPTRLPAAVRPLYDQTLAQMQATADAVEPGCEAPVPGWQQVDIPLEIYAAVRELYPHSRPPFRARPFDVQLIGGMVLGEGKIAEMKTGEGKTIVAPLACFVACVERLQCHVVTVNDYLVQRDRDWVFPFYYHMGLTVGAIHPFHMQPPEGKAQAYRCDVVYGTNSEFGFDYLRDNMKLTTAEQVQKRRDFCIIDEVDSILIDEARTPLIISGPAHDDAPRYDLADAVARHLMTRQRDWDAADAKVRAAIVRIKGLEGDIRNARDKEKVPGLRAQMKETQAGLPALEAERDRHTQYYEVEREKKASHLTHEGVAEAQKVANIGSFYVGANMDFPHLLENALRAHAVYQVDKDYVEHQGEIVIVDENTGRLMIGRQWSDGLHQAVEAKERVKIKQETQTLATVTIQNFFKLYGRLAGMTGTAMTESTEFHEIYKLDVVAIPTNVPVIRADRHDLVFISAKDKWDAILDEIKALHDVGRPVLVGTTSVEKSQMLSAMLTRKHGIRHEVLNAKQHDREAEIVQHAGELGAVMIATNMAGRGTDIKLAPIARADLVKHWQMRNLLPREASPEMPDEKLVALAYRHQARTLLGLKPAEADALPEEEVRLRLMRHWVPQHALVEPEKAAAMSAEDCLRELDAAPNLLLHKLEVFTHVEQMGGLHIVGTERHEARRIDNQLRGRAGRQGDRGSSRFFLSLEDELMQLFAGPKTLKLLSAFGMKEGDAIEHPMITRSVERAQRKVEERNYEIRKNLLEYDEVMEHQRNAFYGIRQTVLEGKRVDRIIFAYIGESVADATRTYLARDFVPSQIAEWCRQQLDVTIEPYKLRGDELDELQETVRRAARDEVRQTVDVTLGEYMSNDIPPEDWDLKGLSAWASTRFGVELRAAQLREMSVHDVKAQLVDAALAQLEQKDLSGLAAFLDPLYAPKGLASWARQKFGLELNPEELSPTQGEAPPQTRERVERLVVERAEAAYRQRESAYPVEFTLDMVFQAAQHDGAWAARTLADWANQRYEMGWTPEGVTAITGNDLRAQLAAAAEAWLHGPKAAELVDRAVREAGDDPIKLAQWVRARLGREVPPDDLSGTPEERRARLLEEVRGMLRSELTHLERFVLLQILDNAWKDHLYAMDQLKDSVGLRGYAEKDPRIEYKREGSNFFAAMQRGVREQVTELIFRARLTPNVEVRNVYNDAQAEQEAPAAAASAAAEAATQGTEAQRANLSAAERAGGNGEAAPSRKERRAAAAAAPDPIEAKKSQHGYKDRKKKRR